MLKKSIIILTIILTDITGNGIDDSIKGANDDIWTRINAEHINNMIYDINTHYTTLAAVIASNPDCIPLSIRRVFAHYIAEYRLVMKDVTQLIWATYIFGIYGDIVEGDIDDDVNSKTGKKSSGDTNPLPTDPSSFAAWTKDTTFAVMLSARIAKYVEDYVS
ncbi:hypothetical protein FOZ61_003105, partial [Perkinsus olseni]